MSNDDKLTVLKALYFRGKITEEALEKKLLEMGYGPQGAKLVVAYLKRSPKEFREDFAKHHESLFMEVKYGD